MWRFLRDHPRLAYVLLLLSFINLVNQMDRYLFSSNAPPFVSKQEFDTLSGPLFTISFTIMGVVLTMFASKMNKAYVLACAVVFWSVMTGAVGFTDKFWEVALVRIGQSVGEAGCTPFAAGLIAAYFPPHIKGTAMSVYNIGIYAGFSLAQSVAITLTNSTGHWQTSYYACGCLGLVIAAVTAFTIQDTNSNTSNTATPTVGSPKDDLPPASYRDVFWFWVTSPSLILLAIAGGVRNAGGFVWGYQVKNWFVNALHVSDSTYSVYMLWIPLVGGSFGVVVGGFVSDKLVNRQWADGSRMGVQGRLLVIVVCLALAAPFGAAALLIHHPVPLGFLALIPVNVIGEMWAGVVFAVILELTPRNMHTTSIALYQFVVVNIGGNAPALVTPLENAIGGPNGFRNALLMLYPGTYVAAAVLFVVVLLVVKRDLHRASQYTEQQLHERWGGESGVASTGLVLLLEGEQELEDEALLPSLNDKRSSELVHVAEMVGTPNSRRSYMDTVDNDVTQPLLAGGTY